MSLPGEPLNAALPLTKGERKKRSGPTATYQRFANQKPSNPQEYAKKEAFYRRLRLKKARAQEVLDNPDATLEQRQAAAAAMQAIELAEAENESIDDDFNAWLVGKGRSQDHARTPWERTPLTANPSVREHLKMFTDQRWQFLGELNRIFWSAHMGDASVDELFLYYRFFVRGNLDPSSIDDVDYLAFYRELAYNIPEKIKPEAKYVGKATLQKLNDYAIKRNYVPMGNAERAMNHLFGVKQTLLEAERGLTSLNENDFLRAKEKIDHHYDLWRTSKEGNYDFLLDELKIEPEFADEILAEYANLFTTFRLKEIEKKKTDNLERIKYLQNEQRLERLRNLQQHLSIGEGMDPTVHSHAEQIIGVMMANTETKLKEGGKANLASIDEDTNRELQRLEDEQQVMEGLMKLFKDFDSYDELPRNLFPNDIRKIKKAEQDLARQAALLGPVTAGSRADWQRFNAQAQIDADKLALEWKRKRGFASPEDLAKIDEQKKALEKRTQFATQMLEEASSPEQMSSKERQARINEAMQAFDETAPHFGIPHAYRALGLELNDRLQHFAQGVASGDPEIIEDELRDFQEFYAPISGLLRQLRENQGGSQILLELLQRTKQHAIRNNPLPFRPSPIAESRLGHKAATETLARSFKDKIRSVVGQIDRKMQTKSQKGLDYLKELSENALSTSEGEFIQQFFAEAVKQKEEAKEEMFADQ